MPKIVNNKLVEKIEEKHYQNYVSICVPGTIVRHTLTGTKDDLIDFIKNVMRDGIDERISKSTFNVYPPSVISRISVEQVELP